MRSWLLVPAIAAFIGACGPPRAMPVEEVLNQLPRFKGKLITIRTMLRSGARCRQGEEGEWKTYCKDCVYCRGPLVVEPPGTVTSTNVLDWPMILGGTWEYKDIRCKGPLNAVECYPFQEGKTYVIRGMLEDQQPPKLLVEKFWQVE